MKLSFSLPSLLCFYWGVMDDKNCLYFRYTTWYFGVHCEIIINKLINNPSPHRDSIFFFILLFFILFEMLLFFRSSQSVISAHHGSSEPSFSPHALWLFAGNTSSAGAHALQSACSVPVECFPSAGPYGCHICFYLISQPTFTRLK